MLSLIKEDPAKFPILMVSAAHFRVKSEIIIENLEALVKNESEY